MEQIDRIADSLDKTKDEVQEIKSALTTLIEAQRNTTKNVDNLTTDMKKLIKSTASFDVIETELHQLDQRVKKIEDTKTWEYRIIIGAIVGGIITIIVKFGLI